VTLIAGLLCSDGVVIASDSAATTEFDGIVASVHEMQKLEVLDDRLVMGVAGSSGIAQEYRHYIGRFLKEHNADKLQSSEVTQLLKTYQVSAIHEQIDLAKRFATDGRPDLSRLRTESLLALSVGGSPRLFHFDSDLTPDEVLSTSPFRVIGTGKVTAHAFIEYLRLEFLGNGTPVVSDGILTLMWAIRFATKTHARDVGGPIQLAVVSATENPRARKLSEADIEEHAEMIGRAEGLIRGLRYAIRGDPSAVEDIVAQDTPFPTRVDAVNEPLPFPIQAMTSSEQFHLESLLAAAARRHEAQRATNQRNEGRLHRWIKRLFNRTK
jgi:Proteasome subunit